MDSIGVRAFRCSWFPCEKMKGKHVMQMLKLAFHKQKTRWKTCTYDYSTNLEECSEVSGQQRDVAVSWLLKLNDIMKLSPETIFTAITLVDRFLNTVKAHSRYLHCIAISCFFVAIKITEEYELIPTARELLEVSCSKFSVAELLRMEMVLLKKLNWNLQCITPFDFLQIFHQLLVVNCNHKSEIHEFESSNFLNELGMKLKDLLKYHWLLCYPPSMLALSLISLELEIKYKQWVPLSLSLQDLVKNNNGDFYMCREELSCFYEPVQLCNYFGFPGCTAENEKVEPPNIDDVCDSIRHLFEYN